MRKSKKTATVTQPAGPFYWIPNETQDWQGEDIIEYVIGYRGIGDINLSPCSSAEEAAGEAEQLNADFARGFFTVDERGIITQAN